MIVGIDLGTTNSLVSYMGDAGPVIIPLGEGRHLLPSVVAKDDSGRLLVGAAARERLSYAPHCGVARFKTAMGTKREFALGQEKLTAPTLSSLILSELKGHAEAHLGQSVSAAVITVPAYFRESQRAATAEAGALAGLRVKRIINEPTAAAIAYGLHLGDAERRIVVVDLGGGTFDVSVLDVFDGVAEVVATSGDTRLGGEDFTDALTDALLRQLERPLLQQQDPRAYAGFRRRCERAKLDLSEHDAVSVAVDELPLLASESRRALQVTRDFFEGLNRALIDRMRDCLLNALRQAGAVPAEIDEVVAVGGASRMCCVTRLIAEQFGRSPQSRLDPDEAVALGAGVQAGLIEGHRAVKDYVVTDITAFSLGVRAQRDGAADERYFVPVINRGETIPISRVKSFWTVHPRQKAVLVEAYQGDRRFVDENEFLAEFSVECPPASDRPNENRRVDVRFTLDSNGLLEVEATVHETGKRTSVVIERGTGRMAPAERAAAVEALKRLKYHPRDLLPNRHLLERANDLHATLPRRLQEALDQVLLQFERALDAQAPDEIAAARRQLELALDWIKEQHRPKRGS